jgi:hypothetical protein
MSVPVPPYGVAIHRAIASGDIHQMRQVAKEAEQFVHEHGDVSAALETLRAEIAKHGRAS